MKRHAWRTIGLTWLLLCGVAHADKFTYIYTDPQGTPIAEADEQGNITKTFDYRPYGQQALGQPPNGVGYTGHVNDPDTDLVYMQARYYDPELDRFLTVDPVGPKPEGMFGFNRYAYARNNPIVNIDLDGRYACKGSDANCSNLEKAMDFARGAAMSSRLSPEQRESLQNVMDFIGTSGDNNKVIVTFKDDSSRGGYATFDKADGITTLTLRPDNAIKNLGKNAVHEGKHGLTDSEREREDNTRSERLDNEIGAYTVQSYYQKALQYSTSSDDPWTYRDGISEKNILNKANTSVNQACGIETHGSCGG